MKHGDIETFFKLLALFMICYQNKQNACSNTYKQRQFISWQRMVLKT